MRIEVVDGEEGGALVEALDREVYAPEVMAIVPWRDVTRARADKRIVVFESQNARCHVGVFWRDGTFNDARVRMAGTGGVMTSAAVRRQGYASKAMMRAADLMAERQVDFGLLFCEPHNEPYYGKLGWK